MQAGELEAAKAATERKKGGDDNKALYIAVPVPKTSTLNPKP
jgi:hypothetical protein